MTTFTRNWNEAYQAIPDNSEVAKQGARRIRELKIDIAQRLAVDHSWAGDGRDGAHSKCTLIPLATDPDTDDGAGILYSKDAAGALCLFYKDSEGNVFQLTTPLGGGGGGTVAGVVPGTIIMVGNTVAPDGIGYLSCDGAAVSRSTYAQLFGAIGVTWGAGDGVSTFNVPDMRGRAPIGLGQGVGLSNRIPGTYLGTESHVLTTAELPSHGHGIAADGANPGPGSGNALVQGVGQTTTIGSATTGNNNAHNNMQPSAVVNFWIKT